MADSVHLTPRHVNVVDGVYIGNASAASDFDFLDRYDITAVINLTGKQLRDVRGKPITLPGYIHVFDFMLPSQELLDAEIPKTYNKLDAIMNVIRSLRVDGRNVLIQCNDGRNKSMLVVGYYLIVDHEQQHSDVISKLETLYFTDQQKSLEARDKQLYAANPNTTAVIIGPAERSIYEADRAERQELRGLTMMTFRKLLRSRGGETASFKHQVGSGQYH